MTPVHNESACNPQWTVSSDMDPSKDLLKSLQCGVTGSARSTTARGRGHAELDSDSSVRAAPTSGAYTLHSSQHTTETHPQSPSAVTTRRVPASPSVDDTVRKRLTRSEDVASTPVHSTTRKVSSPTPSTDDPSGSPELPSRSKRPKPAPSSTTESPSSRNSLRVALAESPPIQLLPLLRVSRKRARQGSSH